VHGARPARPPRGECGQADADPAVALGEVLVAGGGLVLQRRPVAADRRVVLRDRPPRAERADQRAPARAEVRAHHRDLPEADGERQLLPVRLVGDEAPVARDRRVGGVVGGHGPQRAAGRRRRAVVARLSEPARELRELAEQQPAALGGRCLTGAYAGLHPLAQHADRERLDAAGRAPVQLGDGQRRELLAPQRAEAEIADAEELRRGARDRELVQRVKEQVLSEVPLGDHPLGPGLQHRRLRCAHAGTLGRHERGGELRRLRPAVPRSEPGERAVVVAQLLPQLLARDAEEPVEAPLVERQPVVVDPRLGREPVRRRAPRRQRIRRARDDQLGRRRPRCVPSEAAADEKQAHQRHRTADHARTLRATADAR
jgi:hypothetical protein